VVEEQGHDVGDAAVEGAGDAAHHRDGVLLRGEARHCEGGREGRNPSSISLAESGARRGGQVDVGGLDCLAGLGSRGGGGRKAGASLAGRWRKRGKGREAR
jgi:hypothetical protein